jgi:hypothetical protein
MIGSSAVSPGNCNLQSASLLSALVLLMLPALCVTPVRTPLLLLLLHQT